MWEKSWKYSRIFQHQVGPGTHDSHGKFVPVSCKVGDHVLLPDFGGSKVKLEENTYYIYRDTDLLGVLHK